MDRLRKIAKAINDWLEIRTPSMSDMANKDKIRARGLELEANRQEQAQNTTEEQ